MFLADESFGYNKELSAIRQIHLDAFTNGSILIRSAKSSDSGKYACEASNGIGAGLSESIYVSVKG